MIEKTPHEAQMNLYDYFVDTLVDLSDPEPAEQDDVRDDMMQVVSILFEGAEIKGSSFNDGVFYFSAKVT